jgi:quercetin dioxygenase-like cupin family protein
MSKVRVHASEDIAWKRLRDLYPPEMAREISDEELDSSLSYHENGSDGDLHLSELDYQPGATFDLHAHDQDEIIYVVGGSMVLGNRILGPGSSVYIARDTLYGFAAGDDGLRILVFRSDGRVKYYSKDDYLRLRAAGVRHPTAA